jgi:sterol desaturase/sphingolipid hydroxylase (fatty acid hydroxylase superfamily)
VGRGWFAGAALVFTAAWLWSLGRLPERVPIHFGGSGEADTWSSRTAALWVFAGLGLGTAALFAGLVWFLGRIPAEHMDVPHPEYWKRPEHLGRLRRLVAEDVWWLGASTLLLLAVLLVLVVRAAGMDEPRLGPWGPVAIGIYLLGVLARTAWVLTRRYAVPRPT